MLQAVIFDFDGVITDSEILHFRSFNQVLTPYNVKISRKKYYKDYLGLTDSDLFKKLADMGKILHEQVKNLLEQKKKVYEKLAGTDGKIIEGVFDFLQMLERNRVSMAIHSGALLSEIRLMLEDARLNHFFETIVAADHVTKSKPDPQGFNLVLKRLNTKRQNTILPADCVVIEDSHWGIHAAKAAGMHTIAVTNSYDACKLSMAEKIVDRLDKLTIKDLQSLCG